MAQTQKTFAFPPIADHDDLTKEPTAEEVADIMASFLQRSTQNAWMHPDAWLSTDGVRHGPKSGPSGGWAIHHLRRIETGLRGESLPTETKEDLIERFGEDAVKGAPRGVGDTALDVGDDTRVDAVIEESQAKVEDEKTRKKREKKERIQREKAEKAGKENQTSNKRKRADWDDSDAPDSHAGTGANTPYADSMTAYSETWQKKEDYEQSQEVLVGEVGERDGAPVSKQNGEPPVVVEHDLDGQVKVPKKAKTAEEKAARKLAKKARDAERRVVNQQPSTEKKASEVQPEPVPKQEPADTTSSEVKTKTADDKASKRAAKRARKAEKANAEAKG